MLTQMETYHPENEVMSYRYISINNYDDKS